MRNLRHLQRTALNKVGMKYWRFDVDLSRGRYAVQDRQDYRRYAHSYCVMRIKVVYFANNTWSTDQRDLSIIDTRL